MISNAEIREAILAVGSDKPPKEILEYIEKNKSEKFPQTYRDQLRSRIHNQKKFVKKKPGVVGDERAVEERGAEKIFTYKGKKSITSLDEAIDFFEIDLDRWQVKNWLCNSWDVTNSKGTTYTNYQVKVWLEKREFSVDEIQSIYNEMLKKLHSPPVLIRKEKGDEVGVVSIADLHVGAKSNKSNGLILTKDFDLNTLRGYLKKVAFLVNERKFKRVYLAILGDLIESLTGLNHINSWYSMEEGIHHANSIIIAFKIIAEFCEQINNLEEVYMVAGNHDRATERNDQDVTGTAAELVAFMLEQKGMKVHFHRMLVTAIIDNIHYLFTHYHLPIFAKDDMAKIFYEYGKQGMYNVMLGGHYHQRKTKKPFPKMEHYQIDQISYRAITVAPLFTGNYWSETLGFTAAAGCTITVANSDKSNIHQFDYSL